MNMSKVLPIRFSDRLDERTFEDIFTANYTQIYAILFRLTGDRFEADDLTAETFWRLWEHPPAQDQNLSGWLYRVATRLGYNALRANRRRGRYEIVELDPSAPTAENPAQVAEQHIERDQVQVILRQMPLRDVQVLILRHSGLSYKEIAAVVEVAASSVGTILSRAETRFEVLYRRGEKDAPKG